MFHRIKLLILCLITFCAVYPREVSFFTDTRDGKTYAVVQIGGQFWFAENFAYVAPFGQCHAYDNCDSLGMEYGYLYDFHTARKACPEGWHLPTLKEWQTLFSCLGMSSTEIASAMQMPSGSITDSLRSALGIKFSGHRGSDGRFGYRDSSTDFWIDHEIDESKALRVWIADGFQGLSTTRTGKLLGCSVRYVKDN